VSALVLALVLALVSALVSVAVMEAALVHRKQSKWINEMGHKMGSYRETCSWPI